MKYEVDWEKYRSEMVPYVKSLHSVEKFNRAEFINKAISSVGVEVLKGCLILVDEGVENEMSVL